MTLALVTLELDCNASIQCAFNLFPMLAFECKQLGLHWNDIHWNDIGMCRIAITFQCTHSMRIQSPSNAEI